MPLRRWSPTFDGSAIWLNGWHPHLHALWLFAEVLTDEARAALNRELADLWRGAVVRELGPEHAPNERGVDVRAARKADYLTKMGLDEIDSELASEITDPAAAKIGKRGHLTPWQIAERAARGEGRYAELWRAFQRDMKFAKQLTWSKGLKKRFGIGEEPAEEPESVELVARVSDAEWRVVRSAKLPCGTLARLAILAVVDAGGGTAAVREIIGDVMRRWRSESAQGAAPRGPDG